MVEENLYNSWVELGTLEVARAQFLLLLGCAAPPFIFMVLSPHFEALPPTFPGCSAGWTGHHPASS